MKKQLAISIAIFAAISTHSQNASSQLDVKELTLSNGLTVWLNEDHTQPIVYGAVVVNAGSKDCPNTGIAHYFEHIMFKGTEEIGTVDYSKEKPWLDSIAACYDQLAMTKDEASRASIQKHINELSQKAGDYAIPNEFNNLISLYGGSSLNAGTSYDFTFYHNMFTPQYMEHWCLLNSDRLINPVFRLFQGELETVYEEKNMNSDDMSTDMRETIFSNLFGTQPYAYPVIGSTENLKNPKLSEMEAFYKKYYVGSNMGLILCGDIRIDSLMPLLERTFGRIPHGVKPQRQISSMPDIREERTVEIRLPMPLISMEMLAFKGTTEYEPDANALDLATRLLSNDKAGLLDSLTTEGKVMTSSITPVSLNDAGMVLMVLVPNLFGKTEKAETACLGQFDRIASGDFSEEAFTANKMELYREAYRELETIEDRAMKMVMVMSSGHRWQDYIKKINAIPSLSRTDVMSAANRYLKAPFIRFKKKFGETHKDKMSQPGYTPIVPKNKHAESAYAQRLSQLPVSTEEPRLIDLENDATRIPLVGQATLYTVKNPVNDLFEVTVSYNYGNKNDRRLSYASMLLNLTGTDSLSRQQFNSALQRYGADMTFDSNEQEFVIKITGVDEHFEPTMRLVSHFLTNVSPNAQSLDKLRDAAKSDEKSLTEENTDVLRALLQKVMVGSNSPYLQRLTAKEVKKLSGEELMEVFKTAEKSCCSIVYSGALSDDVVKSTICQTLPVELSQEPYKTNFNEYQDYDMPIVYLFDMPKTRQTLFFTYDRLSPLPTLESRIPAIVLNQYFGGGMSSVMFQEVREFRSMAYSTSSVLRSLPLAKCANLPLGFVTITGTQGDKAMNAISLVDSLLRDMPLIEKNFVSSRQECINDISTAFPSFREIGNGIALLRNLGYTTDPDTGKATMLRNITMNDMQGFYERHLKDHSSHRVIGIIGNKKKLNMKELAKYGRVVIVKEKDLFRKK